jgi:hypothetical protein
MSTVAVEYARQQWEEGHRRLLAYAGDRSLYLRLHTQMESVSSELDRRLGQTFTLAELADAYREADHWLPQVLGPSSGADHLALVQDAAFHLHARGAVDYRP